MKTIKTTSIIEQIKQRRSIGLLQAPAPSDAQLKAAVACALSAPDHRRLTPWRFHAIRGDARLKFGALMAQVAQDKSAVTLDARAMAKIAQKALRAPLLVVCTVKVVDSPKVPAYEQVLSAGAAVQNLMLALEACGFGTMWRSGDVAMSKATYKAFGLDKQDYIAAILYVGTKAVEPKPKPPMDVADFLFEWS